VKRFISGRPYWWQWFTIFSLDAVTVAVAWQLLFARLAGARIGVTESVILGLSVWLAYTADRWIEGWRLAPENVLTQRHFFAVRWRWPVFALWCVLLCVDLAVAFVGLSQREFVAGLILLAPVLIYLLSHQMLHRKHPWRLPKEICVAALFLGGTTVFVAAQPFANSTALWCLAASFGMLCFINLALISVWESEIDAAQDQDSLAQKLGSQARFSQLLPWIWTVLNLIVGLALAPAGWRTGFLCVAASSCLLGVLANFEPRWGRQLARVLADTVLLTPVPVLIFFVLRSS
jgi:hypothetical protein